MRTEAKRRRRGWGLALLLFAAPVLFTAGNPASATQDKGAALPGAIDVRAVSFEIEGAKFVEQITGLNGTFRHNEPDKFRGLVLTVRITKPAGVEFVLHPADFALHYYHGNIPDVAPCHGMSFFSQKREDERQLMFFQSGFGKMTSQSESRTVYLDLFFNGMEPDTGEMHLFVAQPVGARYVSSGWRK